MELKLKSESGVQTIPADTKAEEVKEKKEEVGEGELSDDLKKKIQVNSSYVCNESRSIKKH